jgi:2-polyprenyl-3-methyl-5-hydroxy-6-metoxy-1,4-benzoquinol methylase
MLNFGCVIGGFLECAKQSDSKVVGIELEKAIQVSFKKRALNAFTNLQVAIEDANKWAIITAFHVVEHLSDPRTTLKELSSLLDVGGEIIVEVSRSNDALLTMYNNKPF